MSDRPIEQATANPGEKRPTGHHWTRQIGGAGQTYESALEDIWKAAERFIDFSRGPLSVALEDVETSDGHDPFEFEVDATLVVLYER